ncbi:MAG TPA: hypothetical protein PKL94_04320 [Saprospiraceae bacterium]|nr:hypothetical protein [Saprospiraceae bacterium]
MKAMDKEKAIAVAQNETVTSLHGLKMLPIYSQSNLFVVSSLLISCTKLLRKLAVCFKVLYLCIGFAVKAISKSCISAYISDSNLTKDNTPSRLTSVAHLGGLLFYNPLAL